MAGSVSSGADSTFDPRLTAIHTLDKFAMSEKAIYNYAKAVSEELLRVLENFEDVRKMWQAAEETVKMQHSQRIKDTAEKNALETKLKHVMKSLELEMKKRQTAEKDRDLKVNYIEMMKHVITDCAVALPPESLGFLNAAIGGAQSENISPNKRLDTINESAGSNHSPSDFSYDKTEEDIDPELSRNRRRRRRSNRTVDGANVSGAKGGSEKRRSSMQPPGLMHYAREDPSPKRGRREGVGQTRVSESNIARVTEWVNRSASSGNQRPVLAENNQLEMDVDGESEARGHVTYSALSKQLSTVSVLPSVGGDNQFSLNPSTPMTIKAASRQHSFVPKMTIRVETCNQCTKKIKFGTTAQRCKDCRSVCHSGCCERLPIPCTPVTNVPRGQVVTISEFAPKTHPMVPALIVHCTREVEARGLGEVGIYRIPGSEREVRELKDKLLYGKGAALGDIDVHVICGCIKDFLRQTLKESLLTFGLWPDFVKGFEQFSRNGKLDDLYAAVMKLPMANRDTLAHMMLHLHRVASSPLSKMDYVNLEKMFGPCLVGYSSRDIEPAKMLLETPIQHGVLRTLFQIPIDYWREFTDVDIPAPVLTPVNGGQRTSFYRRDSLASRTKMLLGTQPSSISKGRTVERKKSGMNVTKHFESPTLI